MTYSSISDDRKTIKKLEVDKESSTARRKFRSLSNITQKNYPGDEYDFDVASKTEITEEVEGR
jgi:hypothetical protein